ncbi:acyl-CoA dehydrogenase family protein [Nocardioides zeae]|uniref:Acyl-CoA dehydrogenase family protein n=1 Tax=Nocardioides imazamoxiresistens TaxID=3231893 RepID=A0ABU3PSX6_9ACTN|nr:acyl-CoA dehydrogenase family protein [Nocardioides zeae]MDT9591996.1 acyl-CoA dehydrogenase family protein [Nocardioides zeae]
MDFELDEEQVALRDAVRGLLGRTYDDFETRRRTAAGDRGYDEGVWTGMAEMGLLGLPFAEDDGGLGAGWLEVGLVAEQIGRVVAPEPYLAAVVLAGGLVATVGDAEQRATVLGALSAGESLPTLAHAEPGSRWGSAAHGVRAVADGDAWRLDGVKEPVPWGAEADVLVVSAALPDGGTGLFLLEAGAEGVTRSGFRTTDGGRAARVRLDGATATPLGEAGADRSSEIAAAYDLTRVVAAQQAVGAMAAALESTSGYLSSRRQFGVPLKTFQALTFRAADMYVALELARSLALWALMVHADPEQDAASRSAAATRAWAQVAKAGRHLGQEAIQLHGGIGMTAEYAVGTYAAHLTALDQLLGDARHHVGVLARDVGGHGVLDPLG